MAPKRTILIMRHAKSSWDDSSLKDIERHLNKRGNREAPEMGFFLKKLGLIPDHIICSSAIRTRQTVLHLKNVFDLKKEIITFNEDLYYKGAEAYLQSIRNAPEKSHTLLIAGHNPTVEQVVEYLSGNQSHQVMATANIACFESDAAKWSDVITDNCSFRWLKGPGDIN